MLVALQGDLQGSEMRYYEGGLLNIPGEKELLVKKRWKDGQARQTEAVAGWGTCGLQAVV